NCHPAGVPQPPLCLFPTPLVAAVDGGAAILGLRVLAIAPWGAFILTPSTANASSSRSACRTRTPMKRCGSGAVKQESRAAATSVPSPRGRSPGGSQAVSSEGWVLQLSLHRHPARPPAGASAHVECRPSPPRGSLAACVRPHTHEPAMRMCPNAGARPGSGARCRRLVRALLIIQLPCAHLEGRRLGSKGRGGERAWAVFSRS